MLDAGSHNGRVFADPHAVNIIILDDYQDAVRKLKCAEKMGALHAKVFTNTVKGIAQLSVRLRDAEVLVLIRERTHFPRQLLEKLPKLRLPWRLTNKILAAVLKQLKTLVPANKANKSTRLTPPSTT